uniref:Uncharacterized protein n=1 Tax=Beihai levi-like virus 17 TaxID=1922402 RepID=A0A1L3KHY5_9VIRU|nr:hypothetical protein [Beihai levi-like virus 17]
MSSPLFQPFTITVNTADDETFSDVSESNGTFTYRLDDSALPLSVLPRVTASMTRPSGKSGYYVSRITLQSPAHQVQDGRSVVTHSNFAEISIKIHRDATLAEAQEHVKRVLATLQSADLYAMMTEMKSLR